MLRMVRRASIEILVETLKVIRAGLYKPTRIGYEVNISWTVFNVVIDKLIKAKFVVHERVSNHDQYYITKRGEKYLDEFAGAVEAFSELVQ